MKRVIIAIAVMAFLTVFAGPVSAQGLMVYPSKGQSEKQMEQDKFNCYNWAKKQTGFDPMASQQTNQTYAGSSSGTGERPVARGAARGAAGGAIGGAIAGDAGKGAAIGAAGGALIGGARKRRQAREEEQTQQQAQAQQSSLQNDYDRAFSACMEGKGYMVK